MKSSRSAAFALSIIVAVAALAIALMSTTASPGPSRSLIGPGGPRGNRARMLEPSPSSEPSRRPSRCDNGRRRM
jgi:hypothetical protein